ncbi:MAG: hypothetical protein ABI615_11200 [Chthoniobacterales bacterium]
MSDESDLNEAHPPAARVPIKPIEQFPRSEDAPPAPPNRLQGVVASRTGKVHTLFHRKKERSSTPSTEEPSEPTRLQAAQARFSKTFRKKFSERNAHKILDEFLFAYSLRAVQLALLLALLIGLVVGYQLGGMNMKLKMREAFHSLK